MRSVRLLVGLGNPGPRYEYTRHNVGFMLIDNVARRLGVNAWKSKHHAFIAEPASHDLILVKPQTFMNTSGEAVAPLASWWKTERPAILAVYDDLDLPFGRLRMRQDGGSGGHNGVKSLIACLGGQDFPRLRIGIGRGVNPAIDHVLTPFTPEEREHLPEILDAAADGVALWLTESVQAASNLLNARLKTEA